jgi:hypothetical protein
LRQLRNIVDVDVGQVPDPCDQNSQFPCEGLLEEGAEVSHDFSANQDLTFLAKAICLACDFELGLGVVKVDIPQARSRRHVEVDLIDLVESEAVGENSLGLDVCSCDGVSWSYPRDLG